MDRNADPTAQRDLRGPMLMLAAIVIVVVGIGLAGSMFALLAFSALAAIVARRAQLWLLARGIASWLALVITTGGFVLILVVMGVAVVASIAAVGLALVEDSSQIQEWLDMAEDAWGTVTGVPGATLPPIEPQAALGVARSVVAALAPAVTSLAFSVLIVIYVLLGAPGLRDRMLGATSEGVLARYEALATELVTYVKVRALLGAAAALADTVLLLVLGVPYAILWGLMSFLFSFVPNIGFILALIPPAAFALLEHGPAAAIAVVVGYVVINVAFDYVLQPRLVADDARREPGHHHRHDPRLDRVDRAGGCAARGAADDHAASDADAVPGCRVVRGVPRAGAWRARATAPPRPDGEAATPTTAIPRTS